MKRSYGSKCSTTSSSSSQIRSSESVPRICGCGETLLLLKATTQKNNGRFFWRCKNWANDRNCRFFQWADEVEPEKEVTIEKNEEDSVCVNERMLVDVLQKNAKLKKKLIEERKMGQLKMCAFLVSWAFTVMFCVFFVMKINYNGYG
ncbi:hypothetical protein DEO72_LG5g2335 [Vigna unguiculata]|uniref:GRF-type domain-containing protein n=1 Tax=Vigna unguiculata TaxID=3917 RepID=A0A4D6LZF9_VIGUN|nr:hypothetical protein DEO72_LG5g2334 [Vigna unguiculata]QCD94252.1 hypothetical protein DEO72_LG5g2335 [Vigna unguiculata]